MYIWLPSPTFTFDDWKLEVLWSLIDALSLMVDLSYPLLILWVNQWLNFLTLDSFWWYVHCWTHLSYHLPFRSLPSGLTLSTLFTLPSGLPLSTLFTLVLWAKVNTWSKTHFEILGSTSYDSSTSHILVFSHLISNLKIDLKISRSTECMVKTPFWDFECYTSRIQCDSLSPLRAKMRLVTPEEFLKHGFSFFHQILPFSFESQSMWYFGFLI